MYRLFSPHPALSVYIDNYWILQALASPHHSLQEAIFVDGKADILFNFGVPYQRQTANHSPQEITRSNVDGQRLSPVMIQQIGAIDLIGVRFKIGGLAAFVRVPIHQLSNTVEPTETVFGRVMDELEQQLYDCRADVRAQVGLLDAFFLRQMHVENAHQIAGAIALDLAQQTSRSIQDISHAYGYSIRTIDRFFQQTVGISPKTYSRISRLQQGLRRLSANPHANLTEIALALGYHDQAHFTKDFKAFTGHTPATYRVLLENRRAAPPPNLVQILQDTPPRIP